MIVTGLREECGQMHEGWAVFSRFKHWHCNQTAVFFSGLAQFLILSSHTKRLSLAKAKRKEFQQSSAGGRVQLGKFANEPLAA